MGCLPKEIFKLRQNSPGRRNQFEGLCHLVTNVTPSLESPEVSRTTSMYGYGLWDQKKCVHNGCAKLILIIIRQAKFCDQFFIYIEE